MVGNECKQTNTFKAKYITYSLKNPLSTAKNDSENPERKSLNVVKMIRVQKVNMLIVKHDFAESQLCDYCRSRRHSLTTLADQV